MTFLQNGLLNPTSSPCGATFAIKINTFLVPCALCSLFLVYGVISGSFQHLFRNLKLLVESQSCLFSFSLSLGHKNVNFLNLSLVLSLVQAWNYVSRNLGYVVYWFIGWKHLWHQVLTYGVKFDFKSCFLDSGWPILDCPTFHPSLRLFWFIL